MIAYDTNILIYALEGNSPFSSAAQDIVKNGEHQGAILSVLAWQEIVTGAVLNGNDTPVGLMSLLEDFHSTKFIPVTIAICNTATKLTQKYGKKLFGYDAIHIATAIELRADLFITNDRLLNSLNIKEIKVIGLK